VKVVYTDTFYKNFCHWRENNQSMVDKIERLISSIQEDPFKGIGKPETMCHMLSKCWSRRINREHRIVCKIDKDVVTLISCRFHYM
jgi:toxin YoeB